MQTGKKKKLITETKFYKLILSTPNPLGFALLYPFPKKGRGEKKKSHPSPFFKMEREAMQNSKTHCNMTRKNVKYWGGGLISMHRNVSLGCFHQYSSISPLNTEKSKCNLKLYVYNITLYLKFKHHLKHYDLLFMVLWKHFLLFKIGNKHVFFLICTVVHLLIYRLFIRVLRQQAVI